VRVEITIPLLNELPYIKMTLAYARKYLAGKGAVIAPDDWTVPAVITLRGGGRYTPFHAGITGDFSSAAFPACAVAVSGGTAVLEGLDFDDEQGDKFFFELLAKAGNGKPPLAPLGEVDLNATPDLLPAASVLACYGAGETRLVHVAHARIKETDRIAVMRGELAKLGACIEELPDGLAIQGGRKLKSGLVDGHDDHRVVMALAVAALGADGPVTIRGAEAANVTYPGFLSLIADGR
jgi:3-phosphoshikimate 1-carboxyvinyltransferase